MPTKPPTPTTVPASEFQRVAGENALLRRLADTQQALVNALTAMLAAATTRPED